MFNKLIITNIPHIEMLEIIFQYTNEIKMSLEGRWFNSNSGRVILKVCAASSFDIQHLEDRVQTNPVSWHLLGWAQGRVRFFFLIWPVHREKKGDITRWCSRYLECTRNVNGCLSKFKIARL